MSGDLIRHFLKVTGLVTILIALLAVTVVVLACLSRWFLRFQRVSIHSTASWFELTSRAFTELARRKTLAVILVGLACLAFRAALLPWMKVPAPAAHFEQRPKLWCAIQPVRLHHFLGHQRFCRGASRSQSVQSGLGSGEHQHAHWRHFLFQRSTIS